MRKLAVDVVVIGGGSTGAGVVRDVAMRGYSTVLLERADLGQGTTGRFHGLLHSGGRYVVSDPLSATECAQENAILSRIQAGAVEMTGGYFVTGPDDDPAFADKFLAGAAATEDISLAGLRAGLIPILYGGLMSVGVAYTLQVVAQRDARPAPAAIILSLEAVFAALTGWLMLGEILTTQAVIGCALMLCGMIWSQARP